MRLPQFKIGSRQRASLFLALLLAGLSATSNRGSPQSQKVDRDRGKEMLETVKHDIQQYYYDQNFHGMDLDTRFNTAREKIKTATNNGQIFSIIAQSVVELNDSHTFFLPPNRVVRFDYGWLIQMIGDVPLIVAVKPGSEAEAKGLKVGNTVYSIDGYAPTRENLWRIEYSYYVLKPRTHVLLVIQEPDGRLREVNISVKLEADVQNPFRKPPVSPEREVQYYEHGTDLIVCRLPTFELREKDIDEMMKRVKGHTGLIIDLRGNGGGYETTLKRLIGHLFDHDVKIGELVQRNGHKAVTAKSVAENLYKDKLVVLVDSKSASASELFARVMQLEKRAVVIGDRTAGAVMRARRYGHQYERGPDAAMIFSFYAVSVTEADIIMADGKGLEHIGVTPDETLLLKDSDLAAQKDPILARAAALCRVKMDSKSAGAMYPANRSTEVTLEEEPAQQP